MTTSEQKLGAYLEKLQTLQSITDFYDFEKTFDQIHTQFGKEMLEHQIATQKPLAEKEYKKKF